MSEPQVSVLIPARNAEAFIGEQLQALSEQDFAGAWEVVVADNGSTDGTRAVIESWRDRLPPLTVVDAPHPTGVNVARNAAAREARGELLLFADADDEVSPGWVSAMVAVLAEFDLATGPSEQFDDRGRDLDVLNAHGLPTALAFLPYALGCNLGVRRRTFESVGGFDEHWRGLGGDDLDFSWRAQLAGGTLGFSEAVRIRYRQPATLRRAFAKQWGYGKSTAVLARRYQPFGARPWTGRDHLRDLLALGRDLWWLGSGPRRMAWVKRAAWVGGRLRAQLYRDPEPSRAR